MNARETYNAIATGDREQQQRAMLTLLSLTETLATAVLEVAGERELRSGKDPLSSRSRVLLSEFVGLKRSGKGD